MTEKAENALPPMEWLRSFEAAGRHGNFTAAGREIGLTQASVSQHIKALEGWLGISLFRRLPRGVELTFDGESYLNHISHALDVISRGTETVFKRGSSQTLAIKGPASVASLWIAPRLQKLKQLAPDLQISLTSIHRQLDYEAGDSDYEIRFGEGKWQGRTAIQLYQEKLAPIATASFAHKSKNWQDQPLLNVMGLRSGWKDWYQLAGGPPLNPGNIKFDSFLMAYHACLKGNGVLLGSLPLVQMDLNSGALLQLSETVLTMNSGVWLTWPEGKKMDTFHNELVSILSSPLALGE